MRFPFGWGLTAQSVLRPSSSSGLEKSAHFTPRDFIELARPGVGVANHAGDLLFVESTKFSFEAKRNVKSVFFASLDLPQEFVQAELSGQIFWLDDRTVAHTLVGKDGVLELHSLNVNSSFVDSPVYIGTFPTATASNFQYSDDTLVFSDLVFPDGNLSATRDNDRKWANRGTTALVYNDADIRYWDSWTGPKSPSLFSVALVRGPQGKWALGDKFDNLLEGTGHVPEGFHFLDNRVVYSSGPVNSNSLQHQANVYMLHLSSPGHSVQLSDGNHYDSNPTINAKNPQVAWMETEDENGNFGRSTIIVYDTEKKTRLELGGDWDLQPETIKFSLDGKALYITGEEHARVKIFALSISSTAHPVNLTHSGVVSGIQPLSDGRILFSRSSFISPNEVFLLTGLDTLEMALKSSASPRFTGEIQQITHITKDALAEKSLDGGEEFWFKGALNRDVHGWIFKPRGWKTGANERRQWPVAMVVHGGPSGSWSEKWSIHWSPNMMSEHGYFSIWMNPTGSIGFGAEFTDSIVNDWGGKPFVDMKAGFDHVLLKYPEIDPERAVALGASWGGFAMNWLQGHPEYGFKFKALVCHDGIFDTTSSALTSDVPILFNHDFGGVPWSVHGAAVHRRNNPVRFASKWSTPMLIIHGSKDYRVAESQSIAAFQVLQQRGVPSRLLVFPDESHWILGHENSLEWHKQVFQWLDEWVGQ